MRRSRRDQSGAPRRRRVPASFRYRGAEILLGFAVVGAGLAFGGQHFATLIALCVVLTAAMLLVLPELAQIPRLSWVAFGLSGFTALQALPLPRALVAALSPNAALVWSNGFGVLGDPAPTWLPLSIDPGASAAQAMVWFCYGLAYATCVALRKRHGSDWLSALAFSAALAVAAVTLIHGALGLERVYGFHLPRSGGTHRWALGPFINANNLAGYLNAGIFAALGLLTSGRERFNPLVVRAGLFLLIAQSILAGSRAGVFTLALGLICFAGLLWRQRNVAPGRGLLLVFAGLALALVLGGDALLRLLGERDFERKLGAWQWSLGMVRDFPAFGVGRGAYESAFPPYRRALESDWNAVFSHPENIVIQWVVEWGLPVAAGAVVLAIVFAVPALRRARRDPLAACLLLGIGVVALQNLADLGLELPAVGLLLTVMLAGADVRPLVAPAPATWRRSAGIALAGAAAIVLALARGSGATVQSDRLEVAAFYQQLLHGSSTQTEVMHELAAAIRRHPGEPYFAVIGGLLAIRSDDPKALRWAAQALERAPVSAPAHLLAAGALHARGSTSQALSHLRWAAVYDAELRGHAFDLAAAWSGRNAERLIGVFPRGLPGAELLSTACRRLPPEQQIPCLGESLERSRDVAIAEQLADLLWPALLHRAAPCAAAEAWCLGLLERCRSRLLQNPKLRWRGEEVTARILAIQGKFEPAAEHQLRVCGSPEATTACHRSTLDLALRAGIPSLVARAADAGIEAVCPGGEECALAHDAAASAFEQLNSPARALQHRTAAADAGPSFERWTAVARAALDSGLRPLAQRALERAKRSDGASPEQRQRLSALEARALAPDRP